MAKQWSYHQSKVRFLFSLLYVLYMKKNTHPKLSYTVIRQKDGSSQGKYWSYLRSNLVLETATSKKINSMTVASFYKVYSTGTEMLQVFKQTEQGTVFWNN